ncbi:glycine--tRNA ligase subunit beta [Dysgonomonas sp. 521]|uniref:glycine--tRNA ligase subunit beta n=1 Tax=Dysgonomonas sp. 521 TaxID=2302932 RepID=UPI0013D4D5B5|nr:glycine--tRNA ligase subunit beta [Dysgonomonas sp. 521]
MNKRNFIFEIGVEEIPAQYVTVLSESLRENVSKMFADLKIGYENLDVFHTPRRMVVYVESLNEMQDDIYEKVKGPAKLVAFGSDGKTPSKALEGFLNKQGKKIEDIFFATQGKDEYVYIESFSRGRLIKDVLSTPLANLVLNIYQPNPMRWSSYAIKFIRPIRWLLALYGKEIIPVNIECAIASNTTKGNRALSDIDITISNADEYFSILKKHGVIVQQKIRKKDILSQIKKIEQEKQISIEVEDKLLFEINNLVENPACALGRFDEEYLSLPESVIKTPMKTQQRYFPVYKNGKIINSFLFVRNGNLEHIENVIKGNERVLKSRLEDAKFFFSEDEKTTLDEKAMRLKDVVFIDKAGNYADKVARMKILAVMLSNHIGYENKEKIHTVIELMKADLVSSTVREYTEIQGITGSEFAEKEGYPSDICIAIKEQYYPNFSGDKLPSERLSAIVSIADKLDTIMCLNAINIRPSGSADPYGQRRLTLGILLTLLEHNINIDFSLFISQISYLYEAFYLREGELKEDYEDFIKKFFIQRMKNFLSEEKGYSPKILNIISLNEINIYKSVLKAELIKEVGETEWYLSFISVFNRIIKLIKNNKEDVLFSTDIKDTEEAKLMYDTFSSKRTLIQNEIKENRYKEAIKHIAQCSTIINEFIDNNMVLCENIEKRNNRIAFFRDFCNICGMILRIDSE